MSPQLERLALAEAMGLHDRRLSQADAEVRRLREELERAEAHRQLVTRAKEEFVRAVSSLRQEGL